MRVKKTIFLWPSVLCCWFFSVFCITVTNLHADELLETIMQIEQKRQETELKIEEKYIADSQKIFQKQIEILTAFRKEAVQNGELEKVLAADFFRKHAEENLNSLDMEITLKSPKIPDSISPSVLPDEVFSLQKETQSKIAKELRDATQKMFHEEIDSFDTLIKKLTQEEKIQDAVSLKAIRDAVQKELLGEQQKNPPSPVGWRNSINAFPLEKAIETDGNQEQRKEQIAKLKEKFKHSSITRFNGCQDWTESGVLNSEGTLVLTGSNQSDATARLFRVSDGKCLAELPNNGAIMETAFHPTLPLLMSVDTTPNIHIWNATTYQTHADYAPLPHCNVVRAAVQKKGKFAVAGTDKGRVFAWDGNNGKVLKEFENEHTGEIRDLVFHPNGKMFATAGVDGKVCFWNMESEKPSKVIPSASTGDLFCIRFSPDGTKIAVTSKWNANYTSLYDVKTAELSRNYGGYGTAIRSVNFSPDGRFLVTGDVNYHVVIWDILTKEPLWASSRHAGNHIYRVQFTPDQKKLLVVAGFQPIMNHLPQELFFQETPEDEKNNEKTKEKAEAGDPFADDEEDPFGDDKDDPFGNDDEDPFG